MDDVAFPVGMEAILGDLASPVLPPGAAWLKEWRRRYVVRVAVPGSARTVILKVCRLRSPFSWLAWRRYALRELENMRLARQRGMSVPRPLAFFTRRRLGVVVITGLAMEDLAGWQDLRTLACDPAVGALAAARLAIAPLRRMEATGAFHADARDENILLNPSDGEFSVIDWQHAAFHPPGAPWLLEHLAAYYIRKSDETAQAELTETWLPELAGARPAAETHAFVARVSALLREPPSTRARRALRPGRVST
ncbi:MAG: lipopolysaccharide kinase InaA family protein [Opitutales bacterium]